MARFDLTDFEWSVIEPLLPRRAVGGYPGALRSAHDVREIASTDGALQAIGPGYWKQYQQLTRVTSR